MKEWRLAELVDLDALQQMAQAHYLAAGIPIGIIDTVDGSVLVGAGWQDICVNFHRANSRSLQVCQESDRSIAARLVEGQAAHHKCTHGLWDIGMPIIAGGHHLATLFLGQFFYEGEAPDREHFIRTAREFGFDPSGYLAALDRVPVLSRDQVQRTLEYDRGLVRFVAALAERSVQRLSAEAKVRDTERKFRAIFDQSFQLLGVLTVDGRVVEANQTALDFAGVPASGVIGKYLWDTPWANSPLQRREVVEEAVRRAAQGEFVRFDTVVIGSGGTLRNVDFSVKPVFDDSGRVTLLIPEARDITERKRAERSYVDLFENMSSGFVVQEAILSPSGHPVDLRVIAANSAFLRLSDLPEAAVVGRRAREVFPDLADVLVEREGRVAMTGEPATFEVHAAGLGRHFRVSAYRPEAGRVASIFTDVTESVRTQQELSRLKAAVDQAPASIVVTNESGVIQFVNPAFEKVTGYSQREVIGLRPSVLKSGAHDDAFYRDMWATISGGQVWKGRLVNRSKDGRTFTEHAVIAPVRDEAGTICNYVAVKRDITEELYLQDALAQAQRLESIGRLAGGVAHDFNNLLTVILSCSNAIKEDIKSGVAAELEDAEEIAAAGRRAADLTRQLLAFARKQVVQTVPLDLNDVVRGTLKMLQRMLGEDVDLQVGLSQGLWTTLADSGQLEQVLFNFAVNARDAMPRGGKLVIETANASVEEARAALGEVQGALDWVRLRVRDTGEGMTPEVQARVFEPFFTTKAPGKGTGLGLATIYGIVRQANGHATVASHLGKGTTFDVYFPRSGMAPAPILSTRPATARGGTEPVLVVEDDPMVRAVTVRELRAGGYQVEVADGPESALALAPSTLARVRLMVTDVVMPGRSGRALAEELWRLHPRLKVLYVSGHTDDTVAMHGGPDAGTLFLAKPFTGPELLAKVRAILDAS